MNKFKDLWILLVGALLVIFLSGPKLSAPDLKENPPVIKCNLNQIDRYVANKEAKYAIKQNNQSRIIWADSLHHQQTEYVLLYLHGFTASWYEGANLNLDFARKFGCNAYFPRLFGHGLKSQDALLDMKPDSLYTSALEALTIASKLGKKVIIMSTSTGGTLSLKIAAEHPELVHALIMLSPNVRVANAGTSMLTMPWGMLVARMMYKGKYYEFTENDPISRQYWYSKYRLEGIGYLQQLIDNSMKNSVYKKVTCPVFVGYYFKDKQHQDKVVSVKDILKMYGKLGTSADQKVLVDFPEAGVHVIGNTHLSKAAGRVENEVFKFTTNILKINPVKK